MEALLTRPAQNQLDQKQTAYPQKVNRAVSFNAIKDQALALLFLSGLETESLLERLTALFLTNPCLERKHRDPPRTKSSDKALLDFHKRRKNVVFDMDSLNLMAVSVATTQTPSLCR